MLNMITEYVPKKYKNFKPKTESKNDKWLNYYLEISEKIKTGSNLMLL